MIPTRAVAFRRWCSSSKVVEAVSASVVRGHGCGRKSSSKIICSKRVGESASASARVARCFWRRSLMGSTATVSHNSSHASTTTTAAFSSIATLSVDEVTIDHPCGDDNNDGQLQTALAAIVKPYHENQQPVVVRGVVNEAPATKLWSSWDYWYETTTTTMATTSSTTEGGNENDHQADNGEDPMVAVEIGGSYGLNGSERAEIPFSAYLQFLQLFEERHGRNGSLQFPGDDKINNNDNDNEPWGGAIPAEELVYMAQNDLLAPLYKDVMIPDFCRNGTSEETGTSAANDAIANANDVDVDATTVGLGRLYSVMMWLGPRGCVSPLHYDPLDNCFLQHMGRKRVLLFAPNNTNTSGSGSGSISGWHYAGHDGQQSNTSPIDPEVLDSSNVNAIQQYRDEYPLFFEEAPPRLECILEPGDFLYIPSRWWHHVRSIDTSASVNVWWR